MRKSKFTWLGIVWLMFMLGLVVAGSSLKVEYTFISPLTDNPIEVKEAKASDTCNDIDCWIDEYSNKYGKTTDEKQKIKVKLHFLAYKESKYGLSETCGDSGKACGPLQFWEPTWQGYRKIMLEDNLITEIGSRLDMEQALETTAWAISTGRENSWGPLLRKEIRL